MSDPSAGEPTAGADVGTTLVKLALRDPRGETTTEALPAHALDVVASRLGEFEPSCVGVTGGGAPRLAACIDVPTVAVCEFEAWAAGARALLALTEEAADRFLLVSIGTGTSAILVEPDAVRRVGGTALGGGTILGLASALTGQRDFDAICRLAARGDRGRVDLRVADIYPDGEFQLPGEINASSFAQLAFDGAAPAGPADLASGVIGLVGENIGLVCGGIAAQLGVERIVFGGSTLRDNPALIAILEGVCGMLGRPPHFLAGGQFAGALGALVLGGAGRAGVLPHARTTSC